MKPEIGKCFVMANGMKVGPMIGFGDRTRLCEEIGDGRTWDEAGRYRGPVGEGDDIVGEWREPSPIREVVKRELVKGVYGRVSVAPNVAAGRLNIGLTNIAGDRFGDTAMSASELREAAHLFNQLAEYLEDAQN